MWMHWQKTSITPCFEELRRKGIRASVRNLACCTHCAHAQHDEVAYLGFTMYERDVAREYDVCALFLYHELPNEHFQETALRTLRRYFHVAWSGRAEDKILVTKKRDLWALVRAHVAARSVAVYWCSLTSYLYKPPDGRGYKRDLAAFLEL